MPNHAVGREITRWGWRPPGTFILGNILFCVIRCNARVSALPTKRCASSIQDKNGYAMDAVAWYMEFGVDVHDRSVQAGANQPVMVGNPVCFVHLCPLARYADAYLRPAEL